MAGRTWRRGRIVSGFLGRGLFVALLALLAIACGGESGPTDGAVDGEVEAPCESDAICDDGLFCNGTERCAPDEAGADALGCVAGVACDGTCDEATDVCEGACDTPDADGDGHPSIPCGGDDCDDGDSARFPGNPEVCDAAEVDEDCDPATFGEVDRDNDSYIDATCCNRDALGAPVCGDDCDDGRAGRYPGATEVCDEADNDCDLVVDEEVPTGTWYVDVDGDGWGTDAVPPVTSCAPISGRSLQGGDCADEDAARSPSAVEACDGVDNDCNGVEDGAEADATCNRPTGGTGSVCGNTGCECPADSTVVGGRCDLGPGRAVWPLSTSRATSHAIDLAFVKEPRAAETEVEICVDRACATVIQRVRTAANRVALPSGLVDAMGAPLRVVFWRLRSVAGATVSPSASPAWQLYLPTRDAAHATASGSVFDANLDGFEDLVVGAPATVVPPLDAAGRVSVHLGNGFDFGSVVSRDGPYYAGRLGTVVANVGDLDGNGHPDVAATAPGVSKLFFYRLGSAGTLGDRIELDSLGIPSGLGDVDGDGYADVAIVDTHGGAATAAGRLEVRYGGPAGLSPRSTVIDSTTMGLSTLSGGHGVGDVNGDGFADVAVVRTRYGSRSVPFHNVVSVPFVGLAARATPESLTGSGGTETVALLHLGGPDGLVEAPVLMDPAEDYLALNSVEAVCSTIFFTTCVPVAIRPYAPYVAPAGDLDGDGYGEIVVAHAGLTPTTLLGTYLSECDENYFGTGLCVGSTSDIEYYAPTFVNTVRVGWGGPSGITAWTPLPVSFDQQGIAATTVGDVTGDGLDDLSVSVAENRAPLYAIYPGAADRALALAFSTPAALGTSGTYQLPDAGFNPVRLGDVDDDGPADALSPLNIGGGAITLDVLYGNPAGLHVARWSTSLVPYAAGFVTRDVTSDGLRYATMSAGLTGLVVSGVTDLTAWNGSSFVPIAEGATSVGYTASGPVFGQGTFDGVAGADTGRLVDGQALAEGDAAAAGLGARVAVLDSSARWVAVTQRDGRVRTYVAGVLQDTLPAVSGVDRGGALVALGDADGDGHPDLAVGSPSHGAGAGRVEVFLGRAGAPRFPAAPSLVIDGAAGQGLGSRILRAGDLDGDTYVDIAIGGAEVVAIYRGTPTGISTTPAVVLATPSVDDFGAALEGGFDADGDLRADLVVGAPGHRDARFVPSVGALYLVRGATDLTMLTPILIGEGATANQRVGQDLLCRTFDLDAALDCGAVDATGAVAQFLGGRLARGSRIVVPAGAAASGF